MRGILFIQFALLLFGAIAIDLASNASAETLLSMAKQKCITIGEKRICFEDGRNKKSDDVEEDDEDNDEPKKNKKTGNICEGKIVCDPGYVVLDKPNKYGACCEPREGFPAPAPAEAEKCKFPGEVGTPPNCSCPAGTEFMGYKGCLPKKADPVGPSPKKVVNECYTFPFVKGEQAHQAPFVDKCRDVYKGTIKCDGTFESGKLECCCKYSQ
jgi:hypothetical protein